jgi:hypothetical protein
MLAAVLHAAIAMIDFERQAELEILQLAAAPDEKGIALGLSLIRGFAAHDTIRELPQPRIAFPAGEILAIEQRLHVARLLGSGSFRRLFRRESERSEAS